MVCFDSFNCKCEAPYAMTLLSIFLMQISVLESEFVAYCLIHEL